MQIGDVAARTGLSINTIRQHDETGLVAPSARSPGGFRLYTDSDVERLLIVRRMKPLGFTLDEMRELLNATDRLAGGSQLGDGSELRATFGRLQKIAIARREKLVAQRAYADEFIAALGELSRFVPASEKKPDDIFVRSSAAHARTYMHSHQHATMLITANVTDLDIPSFVGMVDDAADESARGTIFELVMSCRAALERIAELEGIGLAEAWRPIAAARRAQHVEQ